MILIPALANLDCCFFTGVVVRRGMVLSGTGKDKRGWRGGSGLNWGRMPGSGGWAGGNLLRSIFTISRIQRPWISVFGASMGGKSSCSKRGGVSRARGIIAWSGMGKVAWSKSRPVMQFCWCNSGDIGSISWWNVARAKTKGHDYRETSFINEDVLSLVQVHFGALS